jgi:hypothetical protein
VPHFFFAAAERDDALEKQHGGETGPPPGLAAVPSLTPAARAQRVGSGVIVAELLVGVGGAGSGGEGIVVLPGVPAAEKGSDGYCVMVLLVGDGGAGGVIGAPVLGVVRPNPGDEACPDVESIGAKVASRVVVGPPVGLPDVRGRPPPVVLDPKFVLVLPDGGFML